MADDVYPPDLMDLMSAAFDAAYDRYEGEPSQALQIQLAKRIMVAVQAGERDAERLIGMALGNIPLKESLTNNCRR